MITDIIYYLSTSYVYIEKLEEILSEVHMKLNKKMLNIFANLFRFQLMHGRLFFIELRLLSKLHHNCITTVIHCRLINYPLS